MYLRLIWIWIGNSSYTLLGGGLPEVWDYKHKVTYKDVLYIGIIVARTT